MNKTGWVFRWIVAIIFFFSFQTFLFSQEGAYVNSISVKQGDTLKFYVSTSSDPFSMRITRFYSNDVKVRMGDFPGLPGGIKNVPSDAYMNGCRWPETFRLVIPDSWEPGMYRATFPTSAGGGGVIFFVKAKVPGTHSNTLLVLNTNTWQAYNDYGGKNLYPSSSPNRSYKVSFQRPSNHGWGAYNFFKHEMLYVDWSYNKNRKLEFATDYDLHADPTLLQKYKVVIFVGHAEYWSLDQRRNIDNYVKSGGKLMILSGNTSWWQVRFEDNGNTLVCYKSRTADPLNGIADSLVTVNWYAPPVNNPENKVIGVSFRNGGFVNHGSTLPASQGYGDYAALNTHHWVYSGTGLKDGDEYGYESRIVGNEVDGATFKWENGLPVVTGGDGTPLNYRILGLSPAHNPDPAFVNEHATPGIFHSSSGGVVFNAATLKWVFGLSSDVTVQKITENVYTRFMSNNFPPDIISWSPFNVATATINNETIQLNKRILSTASGDNIKFSIKALDYSSRTIGFRWYVENNIVGNDSVFNFTAGNASSYNIRGVAFNDKDSTIISWVVENTAVAAVPAVPVLSSPANGTENAPLNLELSWNASSGADFYDVQLSTSESFTNPLFTRRTNNLSTLVTLDNESATYYWRVRAGNSIGNSSYSAPWRFTTGNSIPDAVELLYPGRNQKNLPTTITFLWAKSAGSQFYHLEISADRQFRSIVHSDQQLTDTMKTVGGFQLKKNYWWRVSARNQSGEATSEVRQFSTGSSSQPVSGVTDFEAYEIQTVQGRTLKLSWYSEATSVGEYFEITKKHGDKDWETITRINSESDNPGYIFTYNPEEEENLTIRLTKYDMYGNLLSEAVKNVDLVLTEYAVKQNYPNPFNPYTNIDFILITESRVKMKLFNINGELIRTLIDNNFTSGVHTYTLDGSNLASGIYFYTFEVMSQDGVMQHSSAKKLVLMK
jgi:hypothetical protein